MVNSCFSSNLPMRNPCKLPVFKRFLKKKLADSSSGNFSKVDLSYSNFHRFFFILMKLIAISATGTS